MKTGRLLQNIGFGLLLLGFILMIFNDMTEGNSFIARIGEKNQFFFWGGILLWALGYMKKEKNS